MRKLLATFLALSLFIINGCNSVKSESNSTNSGNSLSGPGYILNVTRLGMMDPKPLKVSRFNLNSDPRVQVVRIVSSGLVFPFVYEIISSQTDPKPNLLKIISESLNKKDGVILKKIDNNKKLGNYLHYYHRQNKDGMPHYVSSNYLFVKNSIFYHLSASNYGAKTLRKKEWGDIRPDINSGKQVGRLIDSIEFKQI